MSKRTVRGLIGLLYAAFIIAISFMFFTNDFGLVDLRKTSVVIGVGLDIEDDDLVLCAQLALPQPAENGESTCFSTVTGRGKTVACALNEVNVKTGFYPKLVFCRLVLLGEGCLNRDVNTLLNYFFDNEYTGLTPKVAACKGRAADMLSLKLPYGDSTTDFIERILSDEAQKSGNVSAVNLNELGQSFYTKSAASHMPYIELAGSSPGEQQESSGGESGEGGQESGKSNGGGSPIEFLCNRTALFSDGRFKGVLGKEQSFAYNLLTSNVRHAYTECGKDDERTVLGLRGCKGGLALEIIDGAPLLKLSFNAKAKLMDDVHDRVSKIKSDVRTPEYALKKGEKTIEEQFEKLYEDCKALGCDLFGARDMLYKNDYKYYEAYKDILYERMTLKCEVKLQSSS